MPKTKNNSGASKRFKFTGTGKIMRRKSMKSHILTKKGPDRKRRLAKPTEVDATNVKTVHRLIPKR